MKLKTFGKGSWVLLLQELLKDWPCTISGGEFRVAVAGITERSTEVKPGFIFVARKGKKEDGTLYIAAAVQAGAVAIVIDQTTISDVPKNVPVILVPDCRRFLSHASAIFSEDPSKKLTVIAVTGTNGKTTVSHFIGQLLKGFGVKTAVIGTTGVFIDGIHMNFEIPQMTTLPAEFLHPLLRKCLNMGVTHVVLEASSLGLSTSRLDHCEIDVGILLNIGSDHYDEHGGKQAYIDAKTKLFEIAKKVIVNRDDDVCVEMSKLSPRPCLYYGTHIESDVCLEVQGTKLFMAWDEESGELVLPILGEYNHMNAAAAISALRVLTYKLAAILPQTSLLKLPEGRMQQVELGGVTVVIDYAHTPDALEAVLCSLVLICEGRLITVFGCGGERDKGKRAEMGEIAVLYSSGVVVTSDNPRSEDPLAIIADIMDGFGEDCTAIDAEPNRNRAIRKAVAQAQVGDVILIAGKGHEKTQHIAEGIFPFSDEKVATRALLDKMSQ